LIKTTFKEHFNKKNNISRPQFYETLGLHEIFAKKIKGVDLELVTLLLNLQKTSKEDKESIRSRNTRLIEVLKRREEISDIDIKNFEIKKI
jgi:hypothetical protein